MKKVKKIVCFLLTASMVFALCACGGGGNAVSYEDNPDEHVNLKWYIRIQEPTGFKEVMEAANEYLNEKLNVDVYKRQVYLQRCRWGSGRHE